MEQTNDILIVTGGTVRKEFLQEFVDKKKPQVVIAVDGGLKIVDELKLSVDLIVGDFDTIEQEIINKYKKLAFEKDSGYPKILEFQPEKDNTDTDIAIKKALELNPKQIFIVGATGTRLDHTIANIHLLRQSIGKQVSVSIYDEHNKIYLANSGFVIKKAEQYGKYVSFLPLTETVNNLTLTGFKYPLLNRTVGIGTSLCISNEIIDDIAKVEFTDGILMVMETVD